MYIASKNEIKTRRNEKKIKNFLASFNKEDKIKKQKKEEEISYSNRNSEIIKIKGAIFQWQAPEYEEYERPQKWYLWVTFILIAIISYAVYTDSPVMAITFILIGVVGYIFITREPRILTFAITDEGIVAGKEIYEFENMESFWIFYEPNDIKAISFKTKSRFLRFLHIPIDEQDPVKIREILIKYLPEEKQELHIVDRFGRIAGI